MPNRVPLVFVITVLYRSEMGRYFYRKELRTQIYLRFEIIDPTMSEHPLGRHERLSATAAGLAQCDLVLAILERPVVEVDVFAAIQTAHGLGKIIEGYLGEEAPLINLDTATVNTRAEEVIIASGGVISHTTEELYAVLRRRSNELFRKLSA